MVTGAMRNTQIAALQFMLSLLPLDLQVRQTALKSAVKLNLNGDRGNSRRNAGLFHGRRMNGMSGAGVYIPSSDVFMSIPLYFKRMWSY